MDQSNFSSERTAKKFTLFYETIMRKANSIESFDLRLEYLRKIVRDCEKITEYAELFDDYDLDENFINRNALKVDEEFNWLLDDNVEGPNDLSGSSVRESIEYYFVTKFSGTKKNEMDNCIDEIIKLTNVLQDEIIDGIKEEKSDYNMTEDEMTHLFKRPGLTDLVRVVESLKESEIIPKCTTTRKIVQSFFPDVPKIYLTEMNYNAIKAQLKKGKHSSNSPRLVKFMKHLCSISFRRKDEEIEDMIRFMEQMQKDII